jgi:hypothetical protein
MGGQFEISGLAKTGDDERERGNRRAVPLRIDGSRDNLVRNRRTLAADGSFPAPRTPSNSGNSTR